MPTRILLFILAIITLVLLSCQNKKSGVTGGFDITMPFGETTAAISELPGKWERDTKGAGCAIL